MPSSPKGPSISPFRWISGYLMRHKAIFLPSLGALFITAGLSLMFPWFLKDLIGDPMNALQAGVDREKILAQVNTTIFQMLIVLAIQAFVGYWRVLGYTRSVEASLNDLRSDLFRHLVKLPLSYFQEQRSGALSNRISTDLTVVRETLLNTVPQAARQGVILIGGIVMILIASWKLTLVMLLSLPVVILAVALFGRKVRARSRDAQDALAEAGTVIEETVQGIADVKAFGNQPLETARYEGALKQFLRVTLQGTKMRAAFVSFIIFVLFGTISGVIWFGARQMAAGDLMPKELVWFILFSIFVGASFGSLPEIISQFQQTAGATERLRELIGEKPERESGETLTTMEGAVEFREVSFRYPSRPDVQVLKDLSFRVEPGKRVAFVGSSGAGKSTLFSLLLGLNDPESGEVLFDGRNAAEISLESLRSHLAIVPQEVLLFGGTVMENIAYGRPGASFEEIQSAAREANAHDFIAALPEGYETMVGPRGTKLSGGQRQRLAIARAILANPAILLLDEATSALDAESERLVNEALEKLMTGRTSLVIAHRLSTVRHADRILVVSQGRIIESGTHDELMAQSGTYKLLAATQLS
jgi:ATP-binding cassette subfamily B protein